VEWLLREEIALLLATLVAFGFLVLGTLELIWPTRPRRRSREPRPARAHDGESRAAAVPPAPPAPPEPPALAAAPLEPPAPAAPGEDRPTRALRVGRALLARALEDPDPASDRRVRLLCRAIACFERGREAAPDDARLREALAAAHAALATADQRAAFRWLQAAMPWRAPELAHAAAGAR
jgi:hypothetical protein